MQDILLHPESTLGLLWLGQEKVFQNIGSQKAQKNYFQIGFFKYSTSQESYIANLLGRIHRKRVRHLVAY